MHSRGMIEERQMGIVLKTMEYREKERIIHVFTEREGLIQLIVKGRSQKRPQLFALTVPFCLAEFVYVKGRSSLFFFRDGFVSDLHLFLRDDVKYLESSGKMAALLLKSQMQGKGSTPLYHLLIAYIRALSRWKPANIVNSFFLKLLKHEGKMGSLEKCSLCHQLPQSCLENGETRCLSHADANALRFSEQERKDLDILAKARRFEEIDRVELTSSMERIIFFITRTLD
jgi:DNA repair protein RecO